MMHMMMAAAVVDFGHLGARGHGRSTRKQSVRKQYGPPVVALLPGWVQGLWRAW